MNITLSADKKVIEKVRKYAREHNTTLNRIIREYMERLVEEKHQNVAGERFLRVCDRIAGDSDGWKWKRSELYEE